MFRQLDIQYSNEPNPLVDEIKLGLLMEKAVLKTRLQLIGSAAINALGVGFTGFGGMIPPIESETDK